MSDSEIPKTSPPVNRTNSMDKPRGKKSNTSFFTDDSLLDQEQLNPNLSYRLVTRKSIAKREQMGWEVCTTYKGSGTFVDGAVTHDLVLMVTTKSNVANYRKHLAQMTQDRTARSPKINKSTEGLSADHAITGMESVHNK